MSPTKKIKKRNNGTKIDSPTKRKRQNYEHILKIVKEVYPNTTLTDQLIPSLIDWLKIKEILEKRRRRFRGYH